jgi:hypothetical protein
MRRFVALVATVAVAAAGVFAVARPHVSPTATPRSSPALHGALVFSVEVNGDVSRLYRWDLASGRVETGSDVTSLVSLVDASGARRGWIGVTSRLRGGRLRASVLRSFGAEVRPTTLLTGDLLAWGAGGASVVGVQHGRTVIGCPHEESILVRDVASGTGETEYHAPTCARVLSVGRAIGVTYLTLRHAGRTSVDFVGYRVLHTILPGHSLVSVSATNDMIVVPSDHRGGTQTGATSSGAGAAVFFRGVGALDPLPFADGVQPLEISSFLGWSRDASTGLVDGRVGLRDGIFELSTGPGTVPRLPIFVSRTPGPAWATYADNGTAFVVTGGQIYALHDHVMDPLSMPPGAPIPRGPVVWLR